MTEVLPRIIGQVKWFNTKAGYGFITVCNSIDPNLIGKDIFVHFSSINVVNSQYRYLIQGEYVEFNIVKTDKDKYEYHADDITGINRGNLMCELRNSNNGPTRRSRNNYDNENDNDNEMDVGINEDDIKDDNKKGFEQVVSKRTRKDNSKQVPTKTVIHKPVAIRPDNKSLSRK